MATTSKGEAYTVVAWVPDAICGNRPEWSYPVVDTAEQAAAAAPADAMEVWVYAKETLCVNTLRDRPILKVKVKA